MCWAHFWLSHTMGFLVQKHSLMSFTYVYFSKFYREVLGHPKKIPNLPWYLQMLCPPNMSVTNCYVYCFMYLTLSQNSFQKVFHAIREFIPNSLNFTRQFISKSSWWYWRNSSKQYLMLSDNSFLVVNVIT